MEFLRTIKSGFMLGLKESPAVFFAPLVSLGRAVNRAIDRSVDNALETSRSRRDQSRHQTH